MNDKKRTTEEFDHWAAWNQTTYQTGSTQPPKHHGGLIAFLLGLVIFLGGISTALSLMNIKLFRQLTAQTETTGSAVAFAQADEAEALQVDPEAVSFPLGFAGQTVPDFWCLYQDIPHGVYVMDVTAGSDAQRKGISPGDVVTAIEGTAVSSAEDLTRLLQIYASGEPVELTLSRSGQNLTLSVLKEPNE